jgi:sortase A
VLVNHSSDQDDDGHEPSEPQDSGQVFHHRKGRTLKPVTPGLQAAHYTPVRPHTPEQVYPTAGPSQAAAAVELIRSKVAALYAQEPDVRQEIKEELLKPSGAAAQSKHQRFMHTLSMSGKPLAQIQTDWHNYYTSLPDQEKHEVWREFYQAHARQPSGYTQVAGVGDGAGQPARAKIKKARARVARRLPAANHAARHKHRTTGQIKRQILHRVSVSANTQAKAKQHLQSLLFGLGTGLVVLLIFLFGFFNEMFIAPFIQPSRHVSATPIIVTSDSVAVSDTPELIIPKINLQVPVVYDEKSLDEAAIQRSLERGVIHYPTTVLPGQQGNASFFGHSSNNIFNKGKYKFAFVLLHELVPGDIFYLTYEKKVYTYRVYDKRVVNPGEVSVLENVPGKVATATLITCDPPGTSTNRLVVWGEQISPDPAGATAPVLPPSSSVPVTLPSEGPTMWTRFWRWLF